MTESELVVSTHWEGLTLNCTPNRNLSTSWHLIGYSIARVVLYYFRPLWTMNRCIEHDTVSDHWLDYKLMITSDLRCCNILFGIEISRISHFLALVWTANQRYGRWLWTRPTADMSSLMTPLIPVNDSIRTHVCRTTSRRLVVCTLSVTENTVSETHSSNDGFHWIHPWIVLNVKGWFHIEWSWVERIVCGVI